VAFAGKSIQVPGRLDADTAALGGAWPTESAAHTRRAAEIRAVGSAAAVEGTSWMVVAGLARIGST
jgi:hypothetical protein